MSWQGVPCGSSQRASPVLRVGACPIISSTKESPFNGSLTPLLTDRVAQYPMLTKHCSQSAPHISHVVAQIHSVQGGLKRLFGEPIVSGAHVRVRLHVCLCSDGACAGFALVTSGRCERMLEMHACGRSRFNTVVCSAFSPPTESLQPPNGAQMESFPWNLYCSRAALLTHTVLILEQRALFAKLSHCEESNSLGWFSKVQGFRSSLYIDLFTLAL